MLAIFKREISTFFSTPIGYLVLGIFLILNGLFLWVFKGDFNIFDFGFADMGSFFLLAPWILLFLIPAITMRSFAEEKKQGTLELLFIKPLHLWQTVMGKFLGTIALAVLAVIPTFLYIYSIWMLGTSEGNLDMGVVWGSYFGLFFLIATYTSIGIFASTLSENQIVAFILGLLFCFFLFYGFEAMATLFPDGSTSLAVKELGMKAHFDSVARGIIDTRDLVYFMSLTLFFIYLSLVQLKNHGR